MAEGGRFGSEPRNPNPPEKKGGVLPFATHIPTREKPSSPPPLKEPEKRQKPVRKGVLRFVPKSLILRAGLAAAAIGGTGVAAYEGYQNTAGAHEEVPSGFTEHLKGIPSVSKDAIFDNNATKGVITEENTIQLTREEYQEIAPPTIDRSNVKEVPIEFKIPPGLDGRTTRKVTLEQGTSVTALIYTKTSDGQIRNVTYTKIASPGEVTGGIIGVLFPGCEVFLGHKGEIQAGDIFPAPISGRVYYRGPKAPNYYKGQKLENGANIGGDYYIEGEHYDSKTGKKIKATVQIHTLEAITKPFMYIPNDMDDSFKEKVKGIDSDGKEVEVLATNRDKIPVVTVQQGEDLFKFIDKPPVQYFSYASPIKSQIVVFSSYHDIGEDGKADTFGGENCINPTLDNKAIVLK